MLSSKLVPYCMRCLVICNSCFFLFIREEARELELQARSKSDISAIHIPKDIKKYVSETYIRCFMKYKMDKQYSSSSSSIS